jgi:mRNA interferase MazF
MITARVDLAKIKRGTVAFIDLDPTQGGEIQKTRPCVIISPDSYNSRLKTIIVVPITSVKTGIPILSSEVAIPAGQGGLEVDSKAQPCQIRCVDKSRITKILGRLSPELVTAVQQSTQMAIGSIPTDR